MDWEIWTLYLYRLYGCLLCQTWILALCIGSQKGEYSAELYGFFPPQVIDFLHICLPPVSLKSSLETSLVAQWLRILLPMQGTWVRSLVQDDPTCRRATKPVHHNYWAWALEPVSHNSWDCVPQLLKPVHLELVLCNKISYRNEKPAHCNKEEPPLAKARESPCTATKTQRSKIFLNYLKN